MMKKIIEEERKGEKRGEERREGERERETGRGKKKEFGVCEENFNELNIVAIGEDVFILSRTIHLNYDLKNRLLISLKK